MDESQKHEENDFSFETQSTNSCLKFLEDIIFRESEKDESEDE